MTIPTNAAMLWAMHPPALQGLLMQEAGQASVPNLLVNMISHFADGRSRPSAPATSQDGATLIVPVTGVLAPAGMYGGGTAYEQIADRVRQGAADYKVGTIVLAIRSPGGTVWGCEEAGDAIYEARKSKPVIAVADPYCFSAAYWLATQASRFYVTTSGEVGSVGVRSGHVDMSGFEDKIGMKTTLVASHPDKVSGHPHAPLSNEDRIEMQASVDEANKRFARAISRGRNMALGNVAAVHGTGKTFSAQRAHGLGAIDGIASLRDVVGGQARSNGRLELMRRQAAIREALFQL